MECAKTVEVVVPSPAELTVFSAACLMTVAAIFSIGSSNIIVLATVTPSFVLFTPFTSSSINTFQDQLNRYLRNNRF